MEYNLEKESKKKIYKRSTADNALEIIKNRIVLANKQDSFVYYVDKAVLFGSYVNSDKQVLGDIDIALYLSPKRADIDETTLNKMRADEVNFSGNIVQQFIYGKEEVCKFVKNRKAIISLHDGKAAEIESKRHDEKVCYIYLHEYEVIYERLK